jgi:hypothetical protein
LKLPYLNHANPVDVLAAETRTVKISSLKSDVLLPMVDSSNKPIGLAATDCSSNLRQEQSKRRTGGRWHGAMAAGVRFGRLWGGL